jgi:hypothetical protein
MKIKFYFATTILMLVAFLQQATAQNNLPDSVYTVETFGAGGAKAALPAGRTTYSYNGTSSLNDGDYMLYKLTNGRPEWFSSSDHTGNTNGRCMVINAGMTPSEFYRDTIPGITGGVIYSMYLYIMNVNTLGTCGSSAILPKLQMIVESYNQTNGSFSPITTITTPFIPQSATAAWVPVGGSFLVPAGVTSLRLRILNNSTGGCGNDLAIDDITFARAANIPTLPVTGLQAFAQRSGDNVAVQWQTLSESNTRNFIIEKSADASKWVAFDSIAAAGYSQGLRTYSITDTKPGTITYYRIKQTDYDSHFAYSNTVRMFLNVKGIVASTFPNPFVSQVQLDINSEAAQTTSIAITDISGRRVFQQAWAINKGTNSIVLTQVQKLTPGMYILTINDADGVNLYKTKIIKN